MAKRSQKPASYEDLEALPIHQVGEIVDGELVASPRPAARHALATSVLSGELSGPFQRGRGGPGGWWILYEPELHLGADVLVPDLAAWRHERMSRVPDVAAFTLVPDWVCEVLSPSTARVDLVSKLPRYAQAGARHAWIVDPALRVLEVFRLEEGRWVLLSAFSGDDRARAEPFEAIELELAALWLE